MYQILLIDYSECYFAKVYSDGEIEKVFSDTSMVPNKHHKGGQSAQRFQRLRELEIVKWFKDTNEKLKSINGEFILGINSVYYNKFYNKLSTYNKLKIKEKHSIEYNGLTGIYQMINNLETNK